MDDLNVQETIASAMTHHQAGRLPQAERLYRQALQQRPDHPQALHFLGMLLHQAGRDDLAVPLMRRSVELDPQAAHYCTNLAEVLRGMGQPAEAAVLCRRAVALDPQLPEGHSCLANALSALGQKDQAVESYRRAIALRPNFGTAFNNLGTTLQDLGRRQEAAGCYRQAIALMPDFSPAHGNLAGVLKELGRTDEAEPHARRALELDPMNVQAHNALGNILKALGRMEEAERSYRRAIELNPKLSAAFNNLGNLLKDRSALAEAADSYRKAIELEVGGSCARPELLAACNNLGNVYKDQGQIKEAIECYRRALQYQPDYADAHSGLLLAMHYASDISPQEIFQEHLRYGQIHEAPIQGSIQPHANDRSPGRRLRLGYLSPDFRQHPVGTFIEPILANHDHAAFEVVCYCDVPRPDAVTQRLRAFADQWHSIIGMTDEQLAGKIRQDGIDILVDLAGHTADNRLRTLARKPAPVQVTYIGYPDTTGLRAVDYRITDGDADPPGLTEQYHTESLIRLPGPFPCYSAPAEAPQANALPALSGGGVTFGSFNNFAKVTAHALALWARILDQVPGSRLLLKAASLGDLAVRQRVQEFFAGKAVSPQRLELLGREPSTRGHLSHYHRIDIALDTFPYCGTTTTCEALWMGVPVVSLAGSTHVARVGTSLLNSVGLAELSAHDEADYVRIACRLAGDLEKLAAMRITLRQRMQRSPLMDGPRLTRELEKVYREMWAEYCRNSPSSPNV